MMFMTACCIGLACWIAILIMSCPAATPSGWQAAWVGLDIAELAGFAATAWAAWHQRQIVIFCMIITGTLLVCDAWFDLALDYGSRGFTTSRVSALVVELPLAFLLFNSARRLVRVTIATMMQVGGTRSSTAAMADPAVRGTAWRNAYPPGSGRSPRRPEPGPMSQPPEAPRL